MVEQATEGFAAKSYECKLDESTPLDPDDPLFPGQWALSNDGNNDLGGVAGADINVIPAWDSATGSGVKIAVIDLGVDADHEDFQLPVVGLAVPPLMPAPLALNWHGTAVGGVAAASTDNKTGIASVAPDAELVSVRVGFMACGDCSWSTEADAERSAIRLAVEAGAHVLVNSWGMTLEDGGVEDEIEDAVLKNRVVIFAAGNHRPAFEKINGKKVWKPLPMGVSFPANLTKNAVSAVVQESLIAVSATNQWDEFKTHRWDTSVSTSSDADVNWGSNRGPEVSLSAPGVQLAALANEDDYICFSGTSAAAPLVGGAAALLLELYPEATPKQIKRWLQEGARDLGATGRDDLFGHGRLDVANALTVAKGEMEIDELQTDDVTVELEPQIEE
jgi:subtilisin family serine protease